MTPEQQELLRQLPSVGALLEREDVGQWIEQTSRVAVTEALRDGLEEVRRQVLAEESGAAVGVESVLLAARDLLHSREAPSLVRVVNATGVVLHTGLGRARLSPAAVEAVAEAAGAYCNLEYDLETGRRGRRQRHVVGLICRLTGAEAATVVNNNAAATLLILQTLGAGREAIVSRGQLVEIGGSYRLPDIMVASGAILREVGTTNRTRIGDYAAAVNEQTALLMRVHTSNYRVVGFTEQASIAEIAELAHGRGLVAVDDLGSGALFDLSEVGLPHEPCVADSLAAGADLVCFSGDKLLGGPQCGVICGRAELIRRIESNPLMRTYRVGKLTLLALEATLRTYVDPAQAMRRVPSLAMLTESTAALAARAEQLREKLAAALPDETFLVCSDESYAGGGSLPTLALETIVLQWRPATVSVDAAATALRKSAPPVIARVRDEAVIFDLRTVAEQEIDDVVVAAKSAAL